MKRIVIAGTSVYGIENMGDEALLSVLVRELREQIPDVEITWLARHPDQALADLYGIDKVIKNLDHDSKDESVGRWYLGLNPGDPPHNLRGIREALEAADLLIIGGDPFNEISIGVYRGLAPQAALLTTLAKFLEKPVLLYSIHMGRPLETPLGRELTKYCVTNATKVTLREDFSREVLEEMEIPTRNCIVLADTAWGLNPVASKDRGRAILAEEGIEPRSERLIGLNFRHQYWVWSDAEWDRYCSAIAGAFDDAIEELDTDVLLIPNCTYDIDAKHHLYQDDRPTHADIVARMRNKDRAHQIVGKHDLFETLSLFPLLDMHFSNRRHSLVFAAVNGVPPVACGGEWHVKPAMDEISLGDRFIRIEDLDAASLRRQLLGTWDDRERIAAHILEVLPELRAGALRHAEVAADLVGR